MLLPRKESVYSTANHLFYKLRSYFTLLIFICLEFCVQPSWGQTSEELYPSDSLFHHLVFFDEFDNEGHPDPNKWHHQILPPKDGSWFNDELQHYTDRLINSSVTNGKLTICALKEDYEVEGSKKSYTSARLNAKFAFTYGKVEVRAKLPTVAGTWPAIWTLGANVNERGNYFGNRFGSVGWAKCGEIDILEQTGWDKEHTISHFHWDDLITKVYHEEGSTHTLSTSDDGFHVFSMEWTQDRIRTFVDGNLVYELENSDNKPFNHHHYLILNLAMGGNLGGKVPSSFSQADFVIDYVRIYQ